MSAAIGWVLAAASLVLLLSANRRAGGERERVLRACHEVRGALHAAGMALHAAPPSPRVQAAEQELRRAAVALADLDGRAAADSAIVDAGALVARHAEAWRAVASAQGARLRVVLPATPVLVHGDALRLAQALANLVANAAEHGGTEIELRVAHDGNERVVLEVCDDGPGLAAPVAALARRPRGARGRGLAIAAEIAARHGGRLAAAPAARGARLRIELPAHAAQAHRPRSQA